MFTPDWMLDPTPYDVFAKDHWSKAPLRVARQDMSYYAGLLPQSDFDFVVHSASHSRGALELLSADGNPKPARTTFAILDAVRGGHSLRINSVHRFSRQISQLRWALEQRFSCHVNVNLYLTPDEGRALGTHYDTHDVFVLQVHGQKKWKLHNEAVLDPLEFLPMLRGESPRDLKRGRLAKGTQAQSATQAGDEFTLSAGDLLYLPRGHWHEAQGVTGSVSCHLTVGMQVFTYADFVSVALGYAAQQEPLLRQALPLGFGTHADAADEVHQKTAKILRSLEVAVSTDQALSSLTNVFLRNRHHLLEGRLLTESGQRRQAQAELGSPVCIRSGLVLGVRKTESGIQVLWRNSSAEFPPEFEEAARFVAFRTRFLPLQLPGTLSDEQKLVFVQRLLDEGVLWPAAIGSGVEEVGAETMRGWFPIHIEKDREQVRWAELDDAALSEPFFRQTLASRGPQRAERRTPASVLIRTAEEIAPAGFIFHISRCGSTLVSNALRAIAGVRAISEPQVIGQSLALARENTEQAEALLRGSIRAFGQRIDEKTKALVIKFSSWNVLHLDLVMRLYPDVPWIAVIREPEEVMVSCLRQPPGWMDWRRTPRRAAEMFGLQASEVRRMGKEDYCASVLGAYLQEISRGLEAHNGRGAVIDYSNLTPGNMANVARFFGIETGDADREPMEQAMQIYSKDPTRTRIFSADSEEKRGRATPAMRQSVERWALTPYQRLLSLEHWPR